MTGKRTTLARRLMVEWSGTASSTPSKSMMEPTYPSVWRSGNRNRVRKVKAVVIARSE
jgi:hypothetical protein